MNSVNKILIQDIYKSLNPREQEIYNMILDKDPKQIYKELEVELKKAVNGIDNIAQVYLYLDAIDALRRASQTLKKFGFEPISFNQSEKENYYGS